MDDPTRLPAVDALLFERLATPLRVQVQPSTGRARIANKFGAQTSAEVPLNSEPDGHNRDIAAAINYAAEVFDKEARAPVLPQALAGIAFPLRADPEVGGWRIVDASNRMLADCSLSFERSGDQSLAARLASYLVSAANRQNFDGANPGALPTIETMTTPGGLEAIVATFQLPQIDVKPERPESDSPWAGVERRIKAIEADLAELRRLVEAHQAIVARISVGE